MATKAAIATVLAYLHELYPSREVSAVTADAWAHTFALWTDEDLARCAHQAAATPGRRFFPTPGEIAEFRAEPTPVINAPAILRQIEKLSAYSPQAGMIPPPVVTVRERFGNAAADAYAAAGVHRCFANDDTTRSIAEREFQKALEAFAQEPATDRLRIESGEACRVIGQPVKPAGVESLSAIVTRALPPGEAA
jgi:hypothetical protein